MNRLIAFPASILLVAGAFLGSYFWMRLVSPDIRSIFATKNLYWSKNPASVVFCRFSLRIEYFLHKYYSLGFNNQLISYDVIRLILYVFSRPAKNLSFLNQVQTQIQFNYHQNNATYSRKNFQIGNRDPRRGGAPDRPIRTEAATNRIQANEVVAPILPEQRLVSTWIPTRPPIPIIKSYLF
jgi:hypothetical protein